MSMLLEGFVQNAIKKYGVDANDARWLVSPNTFNSYEEPASPTHKASVAFAMALETYHDGDEEGVDEELVNNVLEANSVQDLLNLVESYKAQK